MGESDTALAPAKINLVLEVGARRPDGYHELATVFQSIGLYDRVTISPSETHGELVVSGPQQALGELGDYRRNLAWQAAELIAEATGRADPGVHIHLEKNIPVSAGLGGGSSDAAAVLRVLARRWGVDDRGLLFRLASELGSDVPFFLMRGTALGRGRGEILSPLCLPRMWVVLANPGVACSTATVYSRFAASGTASTGMLGERCQETVQVLCTQGPAAVGRGWCNDLADAARSEVPGIDSLLGAFYDLGALGAQVSGSGATVFAVARDADHAESLWRQIAARAAWSWWGSTESEGGEADG